jgi:thioredoxin-like negative regulator of GroEL
MDDLAREYAGRITVARFMIMTRFFGLPAPELREEYKIYFNPTVILFDKGVEIDRWQMVIMGDACRHGLDKLLKARAAKAPAKGGDARPENQSPENPAKGPPAK